MRVAGSRSPLGSSGHKGRTRPEQGALQLQSTVTSTPTHTPTQTMQKHQSTSHAHLGDAGGNQSPQRKPVQMWEECVNSTQMLVLAGNRFFPHQHYNEMTNKTTLFKDLLYVVMNNTYIMIFKLNNYFKSHNCYDYMPIVKLLAI